MRLDGITIALRARTPWEATDLGIALVRAHARRIFSAWAAVVLPVFVVVNALCYFLGYQWPAVLILWWLKPVFDRIPLFVISRAVFGDEPSLRETLSAQKSWGGRSLLAWLTWRRFHPGRAMLLPVDMLEAPDSEARRERVRVLSRTNATPNLLLALIGIHLELVLAFSVWTLALMFVPVEFFSDSLRAMWNTLIEAPPLWAQWANNLVGLLAMSAVEPFYVGAGFGLYLNRRIQLEAWDIELAFRRMAARLAKPLAALLFVAVALASWTGESMAAAVEVDKEQAAAATPQDDNPPAESLEAIFGKQFQKNDADFVAAVKAAYAGDDLSPKQHVTQWQARHPSVEEKAESTRNSPSWIAMIGKAISFIVQYALWIGLALILVVVLANAHRWLPWVAPRGPARRNVDGVASRELEAVDALPTDVPAAVRTLWQQGRCRDALALLYRAGVERLAATLGAPLPAGATEAECLRQARRIGSDPYASLFAHIVRYWQAAAYAQRMPAVGEVEVLLNAWASAPATASEQAA